MNHGGDKLHLLCHTLRESFNLLVAPLGEVEAMQPLVGGSDGIAARHSLEAAKIDNLLGNLHFLVESALLGQVANVAHVGIALRLAAEEHLSAVGLCDAVENANERSLSGTVRSEQAIHAATGHRETHVVECAVTRVLLHHILYFNEIHRQF